MASDLRMVELSDVASINPRRRVQKGVLTPFVEMAALPTNGRDIPLSSLQTRIAKGSGSHFQNGDTLLARITPCLENGKTAQVRGLPDESVGEGSTEFIVLCGVDPADNDFVYYVCRSPDFRDFAIARMEGTSGRQRVAWRSITGYQMALPPAAVRRDSAALLTALDDRIDNLRETNATLEAIAQTLFKSWFVDFDPVRAKAEGREPEGMDADTAALFPSELEDSEFGPIPRGWAVGAVGDIAALNAAKWTARKHPSKVNYVDLSGVNRNRIEISTQFDFDAAPSRARNHLRDGDTIVGTVRPGNRAYAYIHEPEENLTGSTGFAVLSPNKPCLASFVYLALTSDEAIDRLANLADGAAYPAVRPGVVADTPCIHPSDSVLEAFARIATPMLEGIAKNNARTDALAVLRDTLLPRLISGKLRLPEAEREVAAAIA